MVSAVVEAVGNKFVNIPGKMKKSKDKRQAVLYKNLPIAFILLALK
jgi:hypothetical protein